MKGSMMGSSKYEMHPEQFDIDVATKTNLIDSATKEIEELILKRGWEYVKSTNGRIDHFKDDVMKNLVKHHLGK